MKIILIAIAIIVGAVALAAFVIIGLVFAAFDEVARGIEE